MFLRHDLTSRKKPRAIKAEPMAPTAMPAFWNDVMDVWLPSGVASPTAEGLESVAAGGCVSVLLTDVDVVVMRVVSGAADGVVNARDCVSTTRVDGSAVVVGVALERIALEAEGKETAPRPPGGSINVAVMTP